MSRKLRDFLPMINEKLKHHTVNHKKYYNKLQLKQRNEKLYFDTRTKSLKPLKNQQNIRYQHEPNVRWSFGKVIKQIKPRTYKIDTDNKAEIVRNRKFIEVVADNKETRAEENKNDKMVIKEE